MDPQVLGFGSLCGGLLFLIWCFYIALTLDSISKACWRTAKATEHLLSINRDNR
jgi:hypothetical protein